jgi:hypothetical protein
MSGNQRAFGWVNSPPQIKELVNSILRSYQKILGSNLVGFYLHGSLAMNCFNPLISDIDFLAIVRVKLTIKQKEAIISSLIGQFSHFPPKGVEMSIVIEEYLNNFVYPTPFELHYSKDWHERYINEEVDYSEQRSDEDLASHFVITKMRGVCLFGKPIEKIFPEVPGEYYARSILNDATQIFDNIEKNPVYTILNLCRILAFFEGKKIALSKKEGGEWALSNLPPKYSLLIDWATIGYAGGEQKQLDVNTLRSFSEYAKSRLIPPLTLF